MSSCLNLSPSHRTARSTPGTTKHSTGDMSEDFLLLTLTQDISEDSISYEDVETVKEINETECTLSDRGSIVPSKSENSALLEQSNQQNAIYAIRRFQCQFIYYIIITLSIIVYLYSYYRFVLHYDEHLELYTLKILNVDVFYVVSIFFYLFLLLVCFIFAYQYKREKEKQYSPHKGAIYTLLSRLNKSKAPKTRKCLDVIRFYRKIFALRWTEFGVIAILTLSHFILSAFVVLYNIKDYNHTFYNMGTYILSSTCYTLHGYAIVLLASCLHIYHNYVHEQYLYLNSCETTMSDNTATVDIDIIPENQQTDGRASNLLTEDDLCALYSSKLSTHIPTLFHDKFIRFLICIIFIILFITYHMLCIVNWDCYKAINHMMYGKENNYFIVNELLLKLFAAILVSNTCLHFLYANDYGFDARNKSYGFISFIIKPEHILFVIVISVVEIQLHSIRIWHMICVDIYAVLSIVLCMFSIVVFGTAKKIRTEMSVLLHSKTSISYVKDGVILTILSVVANTLLLYNNPNHWLHIRQLCLNAFNVMQLIFIYTLKWMITDACCLKYISLDRLHRHRLQSFLIKVIVLNMYHISYLLIFFVYYYQNILQDDYNIPYRLSFVLSFAHIQLTLWILDQLLCIYLEISPQNTSARGTRMSLLGSGYHQSRYSSSGYGLRKSKSLKCTRI